jgi:chromosome segregation ATPase
VPLQWGLALDHYTMSETLTLEPFGAECNCENLSCKQAFERYQVVYAKYATAIEEIDTLTNQNKMLKFDTTHTIGNLDYRIQSLQRNLELEGAVIKAFQGDIDKDRPLLQSNTVCPNCVGHRQALIAQREFLHRTANLAIDSHEKNKADIAYCKKEVETARCENGKLRMMLRQRDDPFGRNKEIKALREERDRAMKEAVELKKSMDGLKQEKEKNEQKCIFANGVIQSLQSELASIRAERDVLKGKMWDTEQANDPMSRMRFDAAVSQYRQLTEAPSEGRGVKRDYACVDEDTCP